MGLGGLAEEQATLRRLAGLVARGAPPAEVFEAVIGEVGRLVHADGANLSRYESDDTLTTIGIWTRAEGYAAIGGRYPVEQGTVARLILETRRPARIDSHADAGASLVALARDRGFRSSVGAPLIVAGRLWGLVGVASASDQLLPPDTEERLGEFTELLATAIANAQSREDLTRLVAEQAALRRVATLVAEGAPPDDLFAVVAEQVARILDVPLVSIVRYESDGTASERASFSERGQLFAVGTRWSLEGTNVVSAVRDSGRPARINDYTGLEGAIAEAVSRAGIRSTVGSPIVVADDLWGTMVVSSTAPEPLPADTEVRLGKFTDLAATAISNTEAQAEAGRLAEEQSALRRVATLVARGVDPTELFAAATEEVGRLLGADRAGMIRYDSDELVSAVAAWAADGEHEPVGSQWLIDGESLAPRILRTGGSARIDDWSEVSGSIATFVREELGLRSSVGSPIVFDGRVWGALMVHSTQERPLSAETEAKVAAFSELVATAISNSEARTEVRRLADEQAALRRVATLVAREPPPGEVFAAVAEEVGLLLSVDDTRLVRYEDDGTGTVVAAWGKLADAVPVGTSMTLEAWSVSALVLQSERPSRIDDYSTADRPVVGFMRHKGIRSAVGTPIVVEGRVWGAMIVGSLDDEPLPADTELRVREFTELIATAIANIQARSDLTASRARIVEASDDERRRVVRDLHDGAQQRLVHTVITLKLANRAIQRDEPDSGELVDEALAQAERATAELRELAHGILPTVLTRGGLRAGVEALASRMPVPIERSVDVGRLPAAVEATAYFVVAEALTNVAKHSRAQQAAVTARVEDGALQIEVRDDGVGGARPGGTGIVSLGDRLSALSGRLRIESPAGGGTLVAATIPIPGGDGDGGSPQSSVS
jgi:GAF domain-containing protein